MIFMLESCFELGITCGISLTMFTPDRVSNVSEVISSALAFLVAGVLIIAPLHNLIMGVKLSHAVRDKDQAYIDENQELFADKRLESRLAIQHGTIFFIRRYILILLLVLLPKMRNI